MTDLSSSTLTIQLLPEFGWSIQGEPAFGPGSVFQGFVQVSSDEMIQATQVRLVFQAVEAVRPIEFTPGVMRPARRQVLFGVQHILWKGDALGAQSLPFTVQLPLIQYPPSIEGHDYYQCTFRLAATIERGVAGEQPQVLVSARRDVLYRPFVETCSLKQPLETAQQELRLQALDYLPGDAISVCVQRALPPGSSITMSLCRRSRLYAVSDVPELTQAVCSERWRDPSERSDLRLPLPHDLVPSLVYSPVASITYHLRITVRQGRRRFLAASGPTYEFPISIGTLGYGVRAPENLQVYSALSQEQLRQEQPRFMEAVQYEDSLPVYDATRLPSYGYAMLAASR